MSTLQQEEEEEGGDDDKIERNFCTPQKKKIMHPKMPWLLFLWYVCVVIYFYPGSACAREVSRSTETAISTRLRANETLGVPWLSASLKDVSCASPAVAACSMFALLSSEVLRPSNFSFALPDNATVQGIYVKIVVSLDQPPPGGCHESRIFLSDRINTTNSTTAPWDTRIHAYPPDMGWNQTVSNLTYPLVGEDPLWGRTWNASMINHVEFGVGIQVQNGLADAFAFVHCMEITVRYNCTGGCPVAPTTGAMGSTGTSVLIGTSSLPPLESSSDIVLKSDTLSPVAFWMVLAVVGAILLLAIVSTIMCLLSRRNVRRARRLTRPSSLMLPGTEMSEMSETHPMSENESTGSWTEYTDEENGGEIKMVIRDIDIREKIGSGKTGNVYRAVMDGSTIVACKTVHDMADSDRFEKECALLRTLQHPNVVRMFGIFYGQPGNKMYMVMEYIKRGALVDFLKGQKTNAAMKCEHLLHMAVGCAAGMLYLSRKTIIHRDLSARNLLVFKDAEEYWSVKVADVDLARTLESPGLVYQSTLQNFPVRWSPPEVLEDQSYSIKSDVWSFGIVLWEIFSYGELPYSNYDNNADVMQGIVKHHDRLGPPQNCPGNVYSIMQICWNEDPRSRPSFENIFKQLHVIERQVNPNLSLDFSDVDISQENKDVSDVSDRRDSSSSYYNNDAEYVHKRAPSGSHYESY